MLEFVGGFILGVLAYAIVDALPYRGENELEYLTGSTCQGLKEEDVLPEIDYRVGEDKHNEHPMPKIREQKK